VTPRRPFSRLAERAVGALCFERRRVDAALVARLRSDASVRASCPRGNETAPAPIVDPLWEANRDELRGLLATGDPAGFLRWPPVRRTMVKRNHGPVVLEWRWMRRRSDWPRWRAALRETTLGHPRPFPRMPTTSGNALHLAYHLRRFEDATGVRPETATFILEFGGGYGGTCRLLHRLGFRGTYAIFDLPEVSALQRFYLAHAGLAVRRWEDTPAEGPGVATLSNLEALPRLIAARPAGPTLFIATWSLGETPMSLRDPVLAAVAGFDAFLFGYSARFGDTDNRAMFGRWRATLPGHVWRELALPHLGKAEFYLFGARASA
jgi:hypothetical protein